MVSAHGVFSGLETIAHPIRYEQDVVFNSGGSWRINARPKNSGLLTGH